MVETHRQPPAANVLPLAPSQRTRTAVAELEGRVRTRAHAIWCLRSKRLAGLEFLARATHADGQDWDPEIFVPLAQRGGYLDTLTLGIVRQMRACLGQIPATGRDRLLFTINVNPQQLKKQAFVHRLAARLAEIAVPESSQLVVEVTESQNLGLDALLAAMAILKQRGLSIALDDFGSHFANHARLAQVPWDIIKFDRALVRDLPHSIRARTVMQASLGMAKALGAITIAEGVENNRQRTWLTDAGCDLAQGFLWARPVQIHQVVSALGRCP